MVAPSLALFFSLLVLFRGREAVSGDVSAVAVATLFNIMSSPGFISVVSRVHGVAIFQLNVLGPSRLVTPPASPCETQTVERCRFRCQGLTAQSRGIRQLNGQRARKKTNVFFFFVFFVSVEGNKMRVKWKGSRCPDAPLLEDGAIVLIPAISLPARLKCAQVYTTHWSKPNNVT